MPHSQHFLEARLPVNQSPSHQSSPYRPRPLPAPPSRSPGCCPLRNLLASESVAHIPKHMWLAEPAPRVGGNPSPRAGRPALGHTAGPQLSPGCVWVPSSRLGRVGQARLQSSPEAGTGSLCPGARLLRGFQLTPKEGQGQDAPRGARSGLHHVFQGPVWTPSQKGSLLIHFLSCTQAYHKRATSQRMENGTCIRQRVHKIRKEPQTT